MNRIHIVGRKNHGKTTLMVELVRELRRRDIRVGTIKHSKHAHDLDAPGTDSYRHRAAGGDPAAIVTAESMGIFLSRNDQCHYERLGPVFAHCQIVLVEGDIDAVGPKVEVWRAGVGGPCLANERSDIRAVISDDRPHVAVPIWPRKQVTHIADHVWELIFDSR
jgi:molybdopterin-guanine dinucleotide biosynthesis adapter protein